MTFPSSASYGQVHNLFGSKPYIYDNTGWVELTPQANIPDMATLQTLSSTDFVDERSILLEGYNGIGTGGGGEFIRFIPSDAAEIATLQSIVTSQTSQVGSNLVPGVFVPFSDDLTGASGGFIRKDTNIFHGEYFGILGEVGVDYTDNIESLVQTSKIYSQLLFPNSSGTLSTKATTLTGASDAPLPIKLPLGTITFSRPIFLSERSSYLSGVSQFGTTLLWTGTDDYAFVIGPYDYSTRATIGTASATVTDFTNYAQIENIFLAANDGATNSGGLLYRRAQHIKTNHVFVFGFRDNIILDNCDQSTFYDVWYSPRNRTSKPRYGLWVKNSLGEQTTQQGYNTSNRFYASDNEDMNAIAGGISHEAGIRVEACDGLWLVNPHVIKADIDLDIAVDDGNRVCAGLQVTNPYFDQCGQYIRGRVANGGQIINPQFIGAYCNGNSNIATTDNGIDLDASGGTISNFDYRGQIRNCNTSALNAVAGTGTFEGLYLDAIIENANADNVANLPEINCDVNDAHIKTIHRNGSSVGRGVEFGSNSNNPNVVCDFSASSVPVSDRIINNATSFGSIHVSNLNIESEAIQRANSDGLLQIRASMDIPGTAGNTGSSAITMYSTDYTTNTTLAGDIILTADGGDSAFNGEIVFAQQSDPGGFKRIGSVSTNANGGFIVGGASEDVDLTVNGNVFIDKLVEITGQTFRRSASDGILQIQSTQTNTDGAYFTLYSNDAGNGTNAGDVLILPNGDSAKSIRFDGDTGNMEVQSSIIGNSMLQINSFSEETPVAGVLTINSFITSIRGTNGSTVQVTSISGSLGTGGIGILRGSLVAEPIEIVHDDVNIRTPNGTNITLTGASQSVMFYEVSGIYHIIGV